MIIRRRGSWLQLLQVAGFAAVVGNLVLGHNSLYPTVDPHVVIL
jgi:hypothetical protein